MSSAYLRLLIFLPAILIPFWASSSPAFPMMYSEIVAVHLLSLVLRPHGLQHTRLPCSSPSPGACSNSCPLSLWYHPTILSSVIHFSCFFFLSQYQGIFQWVSSSHQVAKILELQLQHQSFQWIFRVDFLLGLAGLISLQFKRLSRVFSGTATWKHQFFTSHPSLRCSSHIHTWLLEKSLLWLYGLLSAKWFCFIIWC